MAVLRNTFTQGMLAQAYDYFFENYDQVPTVYDQIYDVQPSDKAFEQSTSVIGLGKLTEKQENQPIVYRSIGEGFTTYGINHTFAEGYEFSMEAVEDHQRIDNLVQKVAGEWGQSVKNSREKWYADVFNYGGIAAGNDLFKNIISGVISQNTDGLIYDGKPLFNISTNTRTNKSGTAYYNGLALDLSSTNLTTAYLRLTTTINRNEKDEIVSIIPDTLLVPPALRFTAQTIINSTLLPGSTNNDVNTLAGIVKIVEWPYLTSTTAWALGCAKKGLVALNRKEPVIDFYQDEDTKSYKLNIVARWGHRVDNWRFWVGSNFATS
jgi:hypothetical protein